MTDSTPHNALLFVISAPSGAGKTSLVQALLQSDPELCVSVSHTTRARRPNEQEGRDYFFVDIPRFEALRDAGAFLEWARVFDNFYGTGREQVEQRLASGRDVLLEIDWQGARQVRKAAPLCTSIFVLPPSRAALETRLRARRTDSDQIIQRRLRDAAGDMMHCREFDYAVVNDRFEDAVAQLRQIVRGNGEKLRSSRPELTTLLARLVA